MKLRTFISLSFLLFLFVNFTTGQIDTSRNHEIRYGLVGSTLFSPDFDSRIQPYLSFADMSLSYLRKVKSTPYYIKAEISGKVGSGYSAISADSLVGQGSFYNNALFLGVERQKNFKHFGLFIGTGIRGSFVNLKADYNFPDEVPVTDFEYKRRAIGLAGQSTFLFNITDNLYVFLTSTFYIEYTNSSANKQFGDDPDLSYNGFDTNLVIFEGLGLAYKF